MRPLAVAFSMVVAGCAPAIAEACQKCDGTLSCYRAETGRMKCRQSRAGEEPRTCVESGGECQEPNSLTASSAPTGPHNAELEKWVARIEVPDDELMTPFATKAAALRAKHEALRKKLGRAPRVEELPLERADDFYSQADSQAHSRRFFAEVAPLLHARCFPPLVKAGVKMIHFATVFDVRVEPQTYRVERAHVVAANVGDAELAKCIETAFASYSFPKTTAEEQPPRVRVGDQAHFFFK